MKINKHFLYRSILATWILQAVPNCLNASTVPTTHSEITPLSQGKVSLKISNKSLREALRQIEQQTGYNFVFNAEQIDVNKSISIQKNGTLQEIIQSLAHATNYDFQLSGQHIIISTSKKVQQSSIQGYVKDNTNTPLAQVSITIAGQRGSYSTDEKGYFKFNLPNGANKLIFKHVGYSSVTIGELSTYRNSGSNLQVIMVAQNENLEEVVVTALGIKKDSKKLGYAVQELKSKDLTTIPSNNFASQLSGKVAGLTVFNSPNLMQETKISLRGAQPLIVIDGIPVNSNTYDIDPDDIANITVLKGATGSSLYGSKGQNGVIQITTKKGENETAVEFSQKSIFRAGWIVFPETQNSYGNGEQGKYAYFDGMGNGTFDNDFVWGPKLDQKDPNTASGYWETPQWDSPLDAQGNRIPTPFVSRGRKNLENYLENGYTLSNNINISKATDRSNIRLGLGYDYTNGEVPSTQLKNYNASLHASSQITDKFKVNSFFQYNNQNSPNYPRTTYGNTHILYGMLIWAGKDVDMRDFKDYWLPGREGYEQKYFNYSWINNPYYMAYEQTQSLRRNKFFGVVSGEYKFNDNWEINLRQSAEIIGATTAMKYPFDFIGANAIKGNYELKNDNLYEYNTDLFVKYNKEFGKFAIDGFVGASINFRESNWQESKTQGLQVPNIYNLANSAGPVLAKNNLTQYARNSAFVSVDLSYDNNYFLTLSERIDQSSALPTDNNTYTYPSVSGSVILSNLLQLPSNHFLKARGSWAQVRADLAPYQYQTFYNPAITYNGLNSVSYSNILGNTMLTPQKTDGIEVGLNGSFFRNLLTFDATAYQYIDSESIFDQESSLASGFAKYKINGNRFKRHGLELTAGLNLPLSSRLQWNTVFNWSTNRTILDAVHGGKDNLSGIKVGERMDSYLTDNSMQKTADGQLIIGTNGLPVKDNTLKNLGHTGADWTLGWSNDFTFDKSWHLSFLWEARIGGIDQANLNRQMWYSGAHPESVGAEREAYNRGEKYIAEGVNATPDGYVPNTYGTTYKDFVEQYWYRLNGESNIHDLSFLKLREVAFGYTLTPQQLQKMGGFFKGGSFSLIGSNLFLISNFPFADPDIGNGGIVGNQLQFPSTRNIGFNVNLKF